MVQTPQPLALGQIFKSFFSWGGLWYWIREELLLVWSKNIYIGFLFCYPNRIYFSGESMENALRACCKGIKIGKILIHRSGDNGKQVLTYIWSVYGFLFFKLKIISHNILHLLRLPRSSYMRSFQKISQNAMSSLWIQFLPQVTTSSFYMHNCIIIYACTIPTD